MTVQAVPHACPLERTHLWNAISYVERNPVRAGLVERAEDFAWSSAAAHLGGRDTLRALDMEFWREAGGASFWTELLSQEEPEGWRRDLRRATFAGKPLGSEEFLEKAKKRSEVEDGIDFARFAV